MLWVSFNQSEIADWLKKRAFLESILKRLTLPQCKWAGFIALALLCKKTRFHLADPRILQFIDANRTMK